MQHRGRRRTDRGINALKHNALVICTSRPPCVAQLYGRTSRNETDTTVAHVVLGPVFEAQVETMAADSITPCVTMTLTDGIAVACSTVGLTDDTSAAYI